MDFDVCVLVEIKGLVLLLFYHCKSFQWGGEKGEGREQRKKPPSVKNRSCFKQSKLIQIGFRHTGIYKSKPVFWCNIVAFTAVTVAIATDVLLLFLMSFGVSEESLISAFTPVLHNVNQAFKQICQLIQIGFWLFFFYFRFLLQKLFFKIKTQPFQGLLHDGSLIPRLCHLTVGLYLRRQLMLWFFPLLLPIVVDIIRWFHMSFSVWIKGCHGKPTVLCLIKFPPWGGAVRWQWWSRSGKFHTWALLDRGASSLH